ncbi:unnamed protein product [Closterium sp. NIES-53]
MVTVPPLPSLAADGRQVRISLRPAFPRTRGVGRANGPPNRASCPTVSIGAESVTLPSVSLPAAPAAPASKVSRAAFLHVPADDRPCATPLLASLRAAPSAVAALPSCMCAWLLLLRVIPAPVVRACLPPSSGAPVAVRRLPAVLPDGQDLPRVTPAPPHLLPLPPPHTSRQLHWSVQILPLRLRPAHFGSPPRVRGCARAPHPRPLLSLLASLHASPRPVDLLHLGSRRHLHLAHAEAPLVPASDLAHRAASSPLPGTGTPHCRGDGYALLQSGGTYLAAMARRSPTRRALCRSFSRARILRPVGSAQWGPDPRGKRAAWVIAPGTTHVLVSGHATAVPRPVG